MADVCDVAEPNGDSKNDKREFLCGVVEGFYGRPWTPEQRKDLFVKMKKLGLNAYMYAPKDDFKHRAYWRELYSVEEAEHLTTLVQSAAENDVKFFYALSPGLDITYSNPKEIHALKRKLEQTKKNDEMAFFGRSKKDDFRMLPTELGLAPSIILKIIELKDLITNSDRYDEEFIKVVLSVIVEERAATEKQKAVELEAKQKAVVVAQQREREFELEKIKIQLEMQKLSQAPVTSLQLENPKLQLNRIIPRFNSKEDEMGLYLTIFEHQAKFLNIPEKTWAAYLIGSLPPDIA
ncbi:protein O-GlcNAcase [Trichonephila clavipes]|nr:protein O-GlcNAcase [Trichonephila clavipes]